MSGPTPSADDARAPLDTAALSEYLRDRIPGFMGPVSVIRFEGGQSNPTYRLSTPGQQYALRLKPAPAARLLPSAHAVEREFRVQSALAGSAVPVARMYCLCEDESVIGRAFYVMELIDGRIFWDKSLPGLRAAERTAIYDELNRIIAELHRVDCAALGLADYGVAGNYLVRQIARWTRQYRASEIAAVAAMDALIEWLPAHIPQEAEAHVSLVHGDYRLDNVIFHPTEPRILAVIDWELSTRGHPLADFAYHLMSWYMPRGLEGLEGVELESLGIPAASAYIASYERRTGRSAAIDWNFYLAYNLFRMAAIVQGVVKRADAGTASSSRAARYASQVQPLAELGWAFARKV